ncbi:T9SS type A sorting domain-containing protein [Fulvivirga maritima]|uniref:T9SS type A sorting domain-containing protein n=1 Tax=Fulvivirga maritima TaxID=2904247 RepID=UPI001F3E8232|nr:T9SS type A sorting domain-containing protein [Fulvivirga maritima]UII24703.1 T9SS type A sorting domain-containing protein [Fulvivirga maritima]
MKRQLLLTAVLFVLMMTGYAQVITVTGGPGRVNNNTVISGLPFTATVTGLNGTPQRWSVGIGTVNGQLIYNTSSTSISNAIVDRTLTGNIALISVGATNGNGVARYLNVESSECESSLGVLQAINCQFADAILFPVPNGATSYNWSVSPSRIFTNNGSSIRISRPRPNTTYTVTVTITGGVCDGETITTTFNTGDCDGIFEPLSEDELTEEDLTIYPNPVNTDELYVQFGKPALNSEISILSEDGLKIDGPSIENNGGGAIINLKGLTPGTYYLKIIDATGKENVKRFIVE